LKSLSTLSVIGREITEIKAVSFFRSCLFSYAGAAQKSTGSIDICAYSPTVPGEGLITTQKVIRMRGEDACVLPFILLE
jgi:hypothetical protein